MVQSFLSQPSVVCAASITARWPRSMSSYIRSISSSSYLKDAPFKLISLRFFSFTAAIFLSSDARGKAHACWMAFVWSLQL